MRVRCQTREYDLIILTLAISIGRISFRPKICIVIVSSPLDYNFVRISFEESKIFGRGLGVLFTDKVVPICVCPRVCPLIYVFKYYKFLCVTTFSKLCLKPVNLFGREGFFVDAIVNVAIHYECIQ